MRSYPSSRPPGGNVLAMPSRLAAAAPRSLEAIIAAQRAARERHAVEMEAFERELAAAAGGRPAAPAGRVVSLKRAADLIGWRVPRLREHILRRANHPDLPQLGFQPGGVANAPWAVFLDVVTDYVAGKR